jgi:uncharacterized protein YndB with AHSA1/START domain
MSYEQTASVVIERHFAHPPARLWRALTQPWLIAEWLMANDFVADKGHKFSLRTDVMSHWNGIVDCEVVEIKPESRLAYSWWTEAPDGSPGLRTIVVFTLENSGSGTLLKVEQSGFRSDQPDNLHGAKFGWGRNLERLMAVLDSGN